MTLYPDTYGTYSTYATSNKSIEHITTMPLAIEEIALLKEIPLNVLKERLQKCEACTHCNMKHCVLRLESEKFPPETDFCLRKQMLFYGFCKDFSAAAIEDIKLAANGVE